MSGRELGRRDVLQRVQAGGLRLSEAARTLGLSYRQMLRVWQRYRAEGEAGLVHRSVGKTSGRHKPAAVRTKALQMAAAHPDIGPTLLADLLSESEGLPLSRETVRQWLVGAGLRQPTRPTPRHRAWRQRKACFGELVQMDGTPHDWLEGRGPRLTLMSLVDDATGITLLRFAEEETTQAAMDLLEEWIGRYGLPQALYVDRKNVYMAEREPTTEEQLDAQEPTSQFGRACAQLGIRLVKAYSPQAKGRVERKHGVCQDRLLKQMRLAGVGDLQTANAFLQTWVPDLNRRFSVPARNPTDLHRPVPADVRLCAVFCHQETRSLGKDWTVRWHNRWFQVTPQPHVPPSGSAITVQRWRDGSVHLLYGQQALHAKELPARPAKVVAPQQPPASTPAHKPAAEHPWRQAPPPSMDPRPYALKVNELADHYLGPVVVRAP